MSYYYRTYDKVSIPRMVPSALLDASLSSYTNFFPCMFMPFTYCIGENCNK